MVFGQNSMISFTYMEDLQSSNNKAINNNLGYYIKDTKSAKFINNKAIKNDNGAEFYWYGSGKAGGRF